MGHHPGGKKRVGGNAGTNRRAAHVDLVKEPDVLREPFDLLAEGDGISLEFLTEGHRHRVLQLGAAHLEHIGEFDTFGAEGVDQTPQGIEQQLVAVANGKFDGRGVGVVGRLRFVDVVVGMYGFVGTTRAAEDLAGPIGDDLVGVHVGRGAGPTLQHVEHEVFVQLAGEDFAARFFNGTGHFGRKFAQLAIGLGRGDFDHGKSADQRRIVRKGHPGDVEVLNAAQGLNAVVGVFGNLDLPQEIVLEARPSGGIPFLFARKHPGGLLHAAHHHPRHPLEQTRDQGRVFGSQTGEIGTREA